MKEPTREEHLAWCKERALWYCDMGDLQQAFNSMGSDLGKHPETKSAEKLMASLGVPLLMAGHLNTPEKMRKFINGFN
jgi:hypothetical protein